MSLLRPFNLTALYSYSLILLSLILSCQSAHEQQAQVIVNKAIEVHGGNKYDQMHLSFDFRERHYTALRKNGAYIYTREFTDSLGKVKDILNNNGLIRKVNGQEVSLTKERQLAYSNSVNSVIYFALLPQGLNDAAVNKKYLGTTTILNQPYHKIRITFDQQGGGVDYEDEYVYWIHKDKNTMDYLAYSFHTDGGGKRFRKAYNMRRVNGILFSDYHNYKPASDTIKLEDLDVAFEKGQLKKVSDIALENIVVDGV